jgi:hypothetical protein
VRKRERERERERERRRKDFVVDGSIIHTTFSVSRRIDYTHAHKDIN